MSRPAAAAGSAALAGASASPPAASAAVAGPSGSPPASAPPLTASDLDAFFDGLVPAQLEREDIAGAVVAVVKDGAILFAKGYGWADVEARTPVTPDTLFRIGSVGKLFTWTAVMQLVEGGRLDLDRDVNAYLDFRIPAPFGKPVTLRHLLTHTPGFEETLKGLFVTDPALLVPLGTYLAKSVPRQIYAPGTVPAYSNYGAALAGYIVERVSGMPFQEYVAAKILRPLGLDHTTFAQPLPAPLAALVSKGYDLGSGAPRPFELAVPLPAGSASGSATDMARFMIAHLRDGASGDARILRPETARRMHARQMELDPALDGMCFGFYEESRNGQRIIGHAGDTLVFHTDLHLLVDAGVGLFVSYNSTGKGELSPRRQLFRRFLDRYFPYAPPAETVVATPAMAASGASVAGSYVPSRRSDSSFLRLASLLQQVRVSPGADGTIELDALRQPNGEPKRWRQVRPLTYREIGGQDLLVFRPERDGGLRVMGGGRAPIAVLERSTPPAQPAWILGGLVFSTGVSLLVLVLWPVAALVRRHYGRTLESSAVDSRLRILTRVTSGVYVTLVAGWVAFLAHGSSHLEVFSDRFDPLLRALQALGLAGVVGLVAVAYYSVRSWRTGRAWWGARVAQVVVLLAGLSFVSVAAYTRLLYSPLTY